MTDDRPEECRCMHPDQGLPCWPCRFAGFETPNPNADDRPAFPLHPTERFFEDG